jgi:dihydrodipicolinate synthase/N-acetylneuraminate lyase
MSISLEGVFAALTTPFAGDEIAVDGFKKNILRYNTTGLAGYVVLGSTGEAVLLGDDESEKLVAAARATASPEMRVIAGASRESTRLTIEFANRLAGLGADAVLIKPPHYYKAQMKQETVKHYYFEVADKSAVPVLIYNIPQNTGIAVEPATVIELSCHPNIAGIKDSSGILSNLTDVVPGVRPDFHFLLGAGSIFLAGLLLGSSGGILALAAAVPDLCVQVQVLFRRGKLVEARQLQLNLAPLNKALTQTLGIPAIKYTLDLLGYVGGSPRPPLMPLDEAAKDVVRNLLARLGLLESPPGQA